VCVADNLHLLLKLVPEPRASEECGGHRQIVHCALVGAAVFWFLLFLVVFPFISSLKVAVLRQPGGTASRLVSGF